MTNSPPHLVVIGAGPCGIATAYFAQALGCRVTLIEKESFVGGKGASRKDGDYILDFGPHTYHPRTEEINSLMVPHAGDQYLTTPVTIELVLKEKRFSYPFRPTEGMLKFSPLFSAKILYDYFKAQIRSAIAPLPQDSFRNYGLSKFGDTLYDLCFGDYTERVWGIPASEISIELARKKLPKFSLRSLFIEYLTGKSKMDEHIITPIVGYHRKGIGAIYENIVNTIRAQGGEVLLGASVEEILCSDEMRAKAITVTTDRTTTIPCDFVVSTIPIPSLMSLLKPQSNEFAGLASRLEYRDILLVFAYLSRRSFSAAHWIYLVDSRFRFQRLSEQKNLSSQCCPDQSTVVTMEISCPRSDQMWHWQGEQFRDLVVKDLGFFGVTTEEIEKIGVAQIADAYPVYRSGYEEHLSEVLSQLGTIPNLVSTGRQGLFLDIGMHDAMVLGKRALEALLAGGVKSFYKNYSELVKR